MRALSVNVTDQAGFRGRGGKPEPGSADTFQTQGAASSLPGHGSPVWMEVGERHG